MEKKNWDDMTKEEREEYVNQDEVLQNKAEIYTDRIENISDDASWIYPNLGNKNITRSIIIKLYKDGKTVKEIGYHIPISIRSIYKIIEGWKKAQIIIRLYNEEKTVEEISDILSISKRQVLKIVRNWVDTRRYI